MGAQVDWVYSHTDVETKKWFNVNSLSYYIRKIGVILSSLGQGQERGIDYYCTLRMLASV